MPESPKAQPASRPSSGAPAKPSSQGGSRVETGIPGLDDVLDGGLPAGSLTLLAGHAGTGRQIFSLQYLYHGAKNKNEPGVHVSLEQEPADIIASAKSLGLDLEPLIKARKLSIIRPELAKFDALKKSIEDEADRIGAKRLVISPYSLISAYFNNVYDSRKALFELRRQTRNLGCTALVVSDITEGNSAYSETGYAEFVADGVIVLDLLMKKDSSSYARTLFVRKMKSVRHSLALIPMEIGPEGLRVYPEAEVF
ncbi:MAG: hypothetical protein M1530_02520 [Candidatus Marsarchaeota archaeon]|nr:hypothetical protein [Candidatus Marsarchaeota archaeon]